MRIGLLWRGDPSAPVPAPQDTRLHRIFEELSVRGAIAEPVIYAEEVRGAVRDRLLGLDGVLVWVDPIVRSRERGALDAMLRAVATAGVFVSAHPEVIERMGTKEVLHRTRALPCGSDARVYRSERELLEGLAGALRTSGARVLKQNRGSGGNGVWRVERVRDAVAPAEIEVRVQSARRGADLEEFRLGEFVAQRAPDFAVFGGTGCFVDQPYVARLAEGMTRCYFVHDRVAGFGHQYVTALLPPPPGERVAPDPPPRRYYGPAEPEFQPLRTVVESVWLAELTRAVDVAGDSLPVIWDADFLLGPPGPTGEDTYLLCEINVSGVFPIPDASVAPLADAAIERTRAARRRRRP